MLMIDSWWASTWLQDMELVAGGTSYLIRELQFTAPILIWRKGEGLETELKTSDQLLNLSCLHYSKVSHLRETVRSPTFLVGTPFATGIWNGDSLWNRDLQTYGVCTNSGYLTSELNWTVRRLVGDGKVVVEKKETIKCYLLGKNQPIIIKHRAWNNLFEFQNYSGLLFR